MLVRSVQRPPARSAPWASREEQPATIERPKPAPGASLPRASVPATPAAGQAVPTRAVPRVPGAERPAARARIAAAPQRAGQSDGADVTAASNHEHLAAVPVAHANVDSGAAVDPPVVSSGYAVQVTSERSESRAQAAFRALQAKYPKPSFVVPISAPRGSTIGLLSVPLRRRKRRQRCAAD
jgi:hypothetical protein